MGLLGRFHLPFSISPASRECMYYDKDPIATASVFEIEAEDLTELVRQAFSLTHRRHDYYLKQVEKIVMNDPAKVINITSGKSSTHSTFTSPNFTTISGSHYLH